MGTISKRERGFLNSPKIHDVFKSGDCSWLENYRCVAKAFNYCRMINFMCDISTVKSFVELLTDLFEIPDISLFLSSHIN